MMIWRLESVRILSAMMFTSILTLVEITGKKSIKAYDLEHFSTNVDGSKTAWKCYQSLERWSTNSTKIMRSCWKCSAVSRNFFTSKRFSAATKMLPSPQLMLPISSKESGQCIRALPMDTPSTAYPKVFLPTFTTNFPCCTSIDLNTIWVTSGAWKLSNISEPKHQRKFASTYSDKLQKVAL